VRAAGVRGLDGDDLIVLRGFISPYSRQRLPQGVALVPFTRYQYGDAVTLIVDADQDG